MPDALLPSRASPWLPNFVSTHPIVAVHCSLPITPSVHKMCTLDIIRQLVKEIGALSGSLSDAIPKGSKDSKIWSVMNTKEGNGHDAPFETFNCRFDALFGEDCHDLHGRLHHICQGKLGMGLVVLYLSKINWADFPLDLVELKLQCLIAELQHLQCVPNPLFAIYIDGLLDEWIYLARHEPSISLQS